ncbi:sigma-70 family RNA polymerase sigma factor [Streptomyces chilikensis]|uniref:sigma-70 family RNA polymerase sigma factor n=1 Tax=Streptomyces chilikensis TaxID=1194079 RepID=UPI00140E13F9|nr:sigma-70 family RNA polymerase sigma factor [Streptomyces chilikensis]
MPAAPAAQPHTRAEAFETEALAHRPSLLAAARRLEPSCTSAEDLVQETYMKAFRSFHQYQAGTNIRAWLHRILTTTFLTHHRRERVRPRIVGPWDEDLHVRLAARAGAAQAVSAEEQVLARVARPDVLEALHALPAEYRTAVLLADVEGHSYQEVSRMLRIPVGTVGSRVHRGRRRLRHLLSHLDPCLGVRPTTQ